MRSSDGLPAPETLLLSMSYPATNIEKYDNLTIFALRKIYQNAGFLWPIYSPYKENTGKYRSKKTRILAYFRGLGKQFEKYDNLIDFVVSRFKSGIFSFWKINSI